MDDKCCGDCQTTRVLREGGRDRLYSTCRKWSRHLTKITFEIEVRDMYDSCIDWLYRAGQVAGW